MNRKQILEWISSRLIYTDDKAASILKEEEE